MKLTFDDVAACYPVEKEIHGEFECWMWRGNLDKDNYGFMNGNFRHKAHRIIFAWANNGIPDGKVLDHLCQFRACCNPDHLEAVSIRENTL